MRRIGLIAGREFTAAVTNKGFVIGLLVMPAIFAFLIAVMPRLMTARGARIQGEVALLDPTGQVGAELRKTITVEAILDRRADALARTLAQVAGAAGEAAVRSGPAPMNAAGEPPDLRIVDGPGGDLQAAKAWVEASAPPPAPRHLALVVVHADAVSPAPGTRDYGTYDLYVPPNLDERVENELRNALREAIVTVRARAGGVDLDQLQALTRVQGPPSVTVAGGVERPTATGFNRIVPFVFAGLLVFGVMLGGQTLLMSTVEEKSSRVIEVLLSAVSPFELMAGKILGQMAVSMVVLALYVGMGLLLLTSFAMLGLLDPWLVFYLVVFFVITYLFYASVFGAVGAAVTEMRETQSLVTPIMLVLMAPWFFVAPMAREPNSTFSVAMSFLPPVNTFAMMIRMASSSPPPLWQVWTTMAIGLASACLATWVAAKIFKVGLLMYGKPPDFATLVRWAKQA